MTEGPAEGARTGDRTSLRAPLLALVWLALRRTLTPGALALWAAWTALFATREWHSGAIALAGVTGPNSAVADAQARSGVLGAVLLLLTPLLLIQAVRLHGRVAGTERVGFASLPVHAVARQLGLWAGSALAAAGLCVATALAAESAGGWRSDDVRGIVGTLNNPALTLVGDGQRERFELPPLPPTAETLHVRLVVLPAEDPSARIAIGLERADDPSARSVLAAAVTGRQSLEIDLPTGIGPLILSLERTGPGPGVAIPTSGLDVLGAPRAPLWAALELTFHAWLGLALATALVPLLRQFVSAPLAGGLLASLWAAAWLEAPMAGALPAASLLTDLEVIARGLSPGPPSTATLGLTAAACLVSLALAGLREQRDGRPLA